MTVATSDLRFAYEWERGDGVAAPELAATWARLELWVGEDCVTQIEDAETGSARRSIYVPLYPVAEWIAFNWWLLKANVRPATLVTSASSLPRHRTASWMKSHSLRGAGDGYVWPNLLILPEGRSTRLLWHPDRPGLATTTPVRYLVAGEAILGSETTAHILADVVESVLARLDERGVAESPLAREWRAILDADEDEREFCTAAARLGLDPYCVDPDLSDLIIEAADRLDERLLPDFLDSVSLDKIGGGLDWLQRGSKLIQDLQLDPDPQLADLRTQVGKHGPGFLGTPWTTGWTQALIMRDLVGLGPGDSFEFGNMIRLEKRLHDDQALQALGGLTKTGGAALVLRRQSKKAAARFASARALWHLTHDPSPDRFLLTTSHADRQRVERAFAAELLAPAKGVRELLVDDGGLVSPEDLVDVASHFGVSPFVVRHQAENQLALQVA
jgi:hypothetical protein